MTKLSIAAGAAADDYRDLPPKLQHWFHQGHSLKLVPNNDGIKFKCDGCKLPGTGARYECERSATGCCTLDLHIRCALAPDVRELGGHWFAFLLEPLPGEGRSRTFCDACGGATTGFVYHCPDLQHDVHPCCAGLPESFDLAGLSFELRIKDNALRRRCALCADKTKTKCKCGSRRCCANRACWSYRSVDDDVFLHVACATDLACDSFTNVNGVSLGKPMAAQASDTGTECVVVFDPSRGDQEMVQVKEAALRALLLKGKGWGNRGHAGAFERWLGVLGVIVRVVISVIFGDPTAMIVAVGQAALSGG